MKLTDIKPSTWIRREWQDEEVDFMWITYVDEVKSDKSLKGRATYLVRVLNRDIIDFYHSYGTWSMNDTMKVRLMTEEEIEFVRSELKIPPAPYVSPSLLPSLLPSLIKTDYYEVY